MRTFGKVLRVLFVMTYVIYLSGFSSYPAMAKGKARANKAPNTMPVGYMNAPLQQARNMVQVKADKGAVNKAAKKVEAATSPEAQDNSKYAQNPNDDRGQGNMGKPTMLDPYGHDKDSGRERGERGRIMEATLNLEEITTSEFTIYDAHLKYLHDMYEGELAYAEAHPGDWFSPIAAQMYLDSINRYTSFDHEYLVVGWMPWNPPMWPSSTIDYTLTFTPPEEFADTVLEVTTTLTSINEYNGESGLHYDAGQVLVEEVQDVVLGTDNTLDYSYAPTADLVDGDIGFLAALSITITEPVSGATYSITYDNPLYVYLFTTLAYNW